MPVYEYECRSAECGKRFATFRPMAECSADSICPVCSSAGRRVMSVLNWKPFPGSCEYDRRNGFFPGSSSSDTGLPKEDW